MPATQPFPYNFPPFPKPPEGIELIPFEDYQETGIQIQFVDKDAQEVDGLGIPTVQLRSTHSSTHSSKKTKPPPKSKNGVPTVAKRREWWEEWEEREQYRGVIGYDPHMARSDRIHAAVSDFVRFGKEQRWPYAIHTSFDQFRLFAGLLTSVPIWYKKANNTQAEEEESEDDSLSEEETNKKEKNIEVVTGKAQAIHNRYGRRKKLARPPYGQGRSDFAPRAKCVENDKEIKDLLDQAKEEKEEKLIEFLNDIEKNVAVYLSSYMRRQGFHYMDRNLFVHPKLVALFLDFSLRHRAFPHWEEEADVRKARQIVDTALVELPFTSKLAKAIPDQFHLGLSSLFAIKKGRQVWSDQDDTAAIEPSQKRAHDIDSTENRDSKKTKIELVEVENKETQPAVDVKNVTAVELSSEPVSGAVGWGAGSAWDIDSTATDASLLVSNATGWGNGDQVSAVDSGGWGTALDDTSWADPSDQVWDAWTIEQPSLFPILGPTTLPMTHQPGIVEWSVKRVKNIFPPATRQAVTIAGELHFSGNGYGNAIAVERELDRLLFKVEMVPWPRWEDDRHDGTLPRILESSNGVVLVRDGVEFEGDAKGKVGLDENDGGDRMDVDGYAVGAGLKPYNPIADSIVVLMEESAVEFLRTGMGLGGTWVQLLRIGDLASDNIQTSTLSGSTFSSVRYWYMEDMMITLPSYHTI